MIERAFLFTDIEGSTMLWEHHPAAMQEALARHDGIMRRSIEAYRGVVFKTIGDAFCAVFLNAVDALYAAVHAQHELSQSDWAAVGSLRVRMALHLGAAENRDGDYFGPTLNRVARLMSAGHGGQILLSRAITDSVGAGLPTGSRLIDLGDHRLKDLVRPEHIFQFADSILQSEFPLLRSLDACSNNLPIQLTSFVGREREVVEIRGLLAKGRLVTLCGGGGSGKTRLALQVTAEVADEYANGVWFAELGHVTDPLFVPHTVASALRLREEPGIPIAQTLIDFLRDKRMLLLLDNCEHLIGACAGLIQKLLQSCPHLKVVATSQEGLSIPGETTWRVPSLTLEGAVRLFADRAATVDTGFELTEKNTAAILQICRRLDGIPLAIELAAARIRILRPEEIALRLDDRFRFLTAGSRTALPKQQTLRAAIDWSYQLLGGSEGILFRRLSIFSGGFTLESAEAICRDEHLRDFEVFDSLCRLVDKSLVIGEEDAAGPRYRMLESIQEYGAGKLRESGETEKIRDGHLQFFLRLSEQAEAGFGGAGQRTWFERIDREHDNISAALCGNSLALACSMARYWLVRGRWQEGLSRLVKALPSVDATAVERAKALNGCGHLACQLGDYVAAESFYQGSVAIRRELGDERGVAVSLNNLGIVHLYKDENREARPLFSEALGLFRRLGQQMGIAASLNNLGTTVSRQGEFDSAEKLLNEALSVSTELMDQLGMATCVAELGRLAWRRGDLTGAAKLLDQSLGNFWQGGDKLGVAETLHSLGDVAASSGDLAKAREYYDDSLALSRTLFARRNVGLTEGALAQLPVQIL